MYRTTATNGYQPCFLKACVHDRGTVMTRPTSHFHIGEQTIQSLAGVRDRIELKGRAVIRNYMPEQHRAFFAALPFMVVGLADQNGHPWATTLSGPPGFMSSAEENLLAIKAWLNPGDPLHSCIRDGAPVGGLGIEFSTRRRNRINGRIENCISGEAITRSALLPRQTRSLSHPGRRNSTSWSPRKVSTSPIAADCPASCG